MGRSLPHSSIPSRYGRLFGTYWRYSCMNFSSKRSRATGHPKRPRIAPSALKRKTCQVATLLTVWIATFSLIPLLFPPNKEIHSVHLSRTKRQWWNHHHTILKVRRESDVSDASCTCLDASHHCCDRRIYRAHKMGFLLIEKLFAQFHGVRRMDIAPSIDLSPDDRRRYVIVTRNFHDSIISGYLYHKSGRECWLSEEGKSFIKNRKRYSGWLQNHDWERRLGYASPWIPRQGRSLCHYLAQESEEDGMRVYIDWSMSMWYDSIIDLKTKANKVGANTTSIFFACYEALSEPSTQLHSAERILSWLYPGSLPTDAVIQLQSYYDGGHATTKDDRIRGRLRTLVQNLDTTIFDGKIKNADNELQCL